VDLNRCRWAYLLLCYSLASCAMNGSHDPIRLDQSFDTREVVLRRNQMLELAFSENPTTGFRWELIETGAPVCALRHDSFDVASGGVGKGGTRRWLFEAVSVGVGTISLVYRRSWEDKAPARTFTLTVRVE